MTKETRPDSQFRRMEYDSMNRVIDTYGFANEHTHYDRDPAGNVWQMIDPKNAIYGFGYDQLNRKTSAAYPPDATSANRTETWSYTTGGVLDYHINPGGQVNRFHFDPRNRLDHSWWDNAVGPDITAGYDAASRLTSIVTNSGVTTVAFGYDDANRKVWEDQTLAGYPTRRVNTPRDADGNRAYLQVPDWYYITYGYTQRNQLASVDGFATFQYDKNGNMLNRNGTWIYANQSNFAYDQLNRVSQAEQGGANGSIYARSHYRYDNLSREIATWRDEQGSKGERFGYDAMGQLTSADYNADDVSNGNAFNPTRTVSYNVDALNRNSVTDNGTYIGYAHNEMNEYTAVGGLGVGYDENFNLTGFNGATYGYNSVSQLTSASGNGNSAQFTYDGLGRCVRRTVNGTTRIFTYDGWKPMLEWDGAGNWVAWNIYGAGADEILARYDSSDRVLIYKQDKHGNVVGLLDSFGNVIEKYTYDAFGQPTITDWNGNVRSQSAYGNRFMFTSREYIAELGIYDYRFRFYHPGLGRFMQGDPIGFGGGDANLFRYCGGDPVNRRDPFGLDDGDDSEGPPTPYQNEAMGNPGSGSNVFTRSGSDSLIDRVIDYLNGIGRVGGGGTVGSSGPSGPAGVGGFGSNDHGSSGPSGGGNGLFGSVDSHSSDGGGGGGRNGVARAITDWLIGAANAYARTANWLAGTGPERTVYGPGTVEVQQMMGSPFAAETIAAFKSAGSPAGGIQRNGGNDMFNPFAAGLFNPTRQFVGTYNASVDPFGQEQVLVILQNQTSMTSASYHLFGSWSRSDFRPGGTVEQYYWWIEPAP